MTAAPDRFTISITIGNIAAIQRPVRTATSVSSSLASPKRAVSSRLADEGADDADAGDLLAQDPVHGVDPHLHHPEPRDHPA